MRHRGEWKEGAGGYGMCCFVFWALILPVGVAVRRLGEEF